MNAMNFSSTFIVLALTTQAVRAEPSIGDLVKQLGDPRFSKREVAQRDLLQRSPHIIAELDRLAEKTDPETQERVRKIQYELSGLRDLDELVEVLGKAENQIAPGRNPIHVEMHKLLTKNPLRTGDHLLRLIADPKHKRHGLALWAFEQHNDCMTPFHIESYIQLRTEIRTISRSKYPANIPVAIRCEGKVREFSDAWLLNKGFFGKRKEYLDGNLYDPPGRKRDGISTEGLGEGVHRVQFGMEYAITRDGVLYRGEIRSLVSEIEILPRDTPDTLSAPDTEALRNRMNEVLSIEEIDERIVSPKSVGVHEGTTFRINTPMLRIRKSLDVDICFEVEIHELKSGRIFQGDPIVLRRGSDYSSTLGLTGTDAHAFVKQFRDPVKVKVVLRPSRALALGDPEVIGYYPRPITSGELWMRVTPLQDAKQTR